MAHLQEQAHPGDIGSGWGVELEQPADSVPATPEGYRNLDRLHARIQPLFFRPNDGADSASHREAGQDVHAPLGVATHEQDEGNGEVHGEHEQRRQRGDRRRPGGGVPAEHDPAPDRRGAHTRSLRHRLVGLADRGKLPGFLHPTVVFSYN